jgi:transglutaminase superfamily protein
VAVIERAVVRKGTVTSMILGRVLPHALMTAFLLYFLTMKLPTLHNSLALVLGLYTVFTFLHSFTAYKGLRFSIVLVSTVGISVVAWLIMHAMSFPTEAGNFYAQLLSSFIIALFIGSAFNNYLFLSSRFYYVVEIALLNAVWLILIVTGLDAPIQDAIALSIPVVAYSLYILLFDYAFLQPLHSRDKARLFLKYAAVIVILILATVFGFLSGISKSQEEISRSYSLMSSKGGLYVMDDRAKMEEEFRIPLDSKELVFIANIKSTLLYGKRENIGYYLKFHSLYNYDPETAEFNGRSDEMEDPYFYVKQVDITAEQGTPRHLTVDLAGKNIIPDYALRSEGAATIYNIKLDTKQSFTNNLTYRFVAYPGKDSVMIGDARLPVLGVYRLFNRISMLNIIPVGTSGQFFEFDYNKEILKQTRQYYNEDAIPTSFAQQYLNYDGLEQDIVDSMKTLLKGKRHLEDKVQTVFDFFTARDDEGTPVFSYDLKPGKSPDATESMLHYFLMNNRRGYCTYYATAATLFFRVAGIPARVAIGFVPGQTSKKNPGWYYVYSQQGHAWTEIYLGPNLGWLDVDVTPAGDNELAPPPPDPSPPTPPVPPKPVYVLRGVATQSAPLLLEPHSMLSRSEQVDWPHCPDFAMKSITALFDSSYGNKNRAASVLSTVVEGDTVILTGRKEVNIDANDCSFKEFRWYSIKRIQQQTRDSLAPAEDASSTSGFAIPWTLLLTLLGLLIVIIHFLPTLHLWMLRSRAMGTNDARQRFGLLREWLMMNFHLNGYPSIHETDMEYAHRLQSEAGAHLEAFFRSYIRSRYYYCDSDGTEIVSASAIQEVKRVIREQKNIFQRLWARVHLWEYFRVINRKKTA